MNVWFYDNRKKIGIISIILIFNLIIFAFLKIVGCATFFKALIIDIIVFLFICFVVGLIMLLCYCFDPYVENYNIRTGDKLSFWEYIKNDFKGNKTKNY